jgi:hypothetical protein
MTAYEKIKEIYDGTRLDIFVMATSHLLDIGWRTAEKITDKQIDNLEGNGLMTKEFCQELVRIARNIAKACNAVEFIQFCQVEKLFDTKGFKSRSKGNRRTTNGCI